MTGYTVHTGSSAEFSDGWDRIFGKKPSRSKTKSGAQKSSETKPATGSSATGKLSKSASGKTSAKTSRKAASKPNKKAQ